MKESFRAGLLRLLAFLAISIYTYSAVAVLRSVIFGDDGGIASIALYAAVLAAGFPAAAALKDEDRELYKKIAAIPAVKLFAFTFNIEDRIRFIASAAVYASLLLPVPAALLVYGGKGLIRMLFEIAVTLLPYLAIIRNRHAGFSKIMSGRRGATGFVVMLAAVELAALVGTVGHLKPYLFMAAYAYMLLFLILRNQEDIDVNIYDKKHIEKSILPRDLRSFNVKAVVVLFSAILVLFNLKPIVAWLLNLAGRLSLYFTRFLIWLLNLLYPWGNSAADRPTQPANSGPLGMDVSGINPWSNFIYNVIKYFVMIYVAYSLIIFLSRKLAVLAVKLWGLLRKLISWDREARESQTGDYKDETEIVKPLRDRDRRHALKNLSKRAGRSLKSIADPVERIRFIYASILEMLGVCGIKNEISDTTLDILKKAQVVKGMEEPLGEITGVYNTVRYDSRIPGPETLSEAGRRYGEAMELLRR